MTKIDVEKTSCMTLKHKIWRVAVSNAQNISGHTLPGQRCLEFVSVILQLFGVGLAILDAFKPILVVIVWQNDVGKIIQYGGLVPSALVKAWIEMHGGNDLGFVNKLNIACFKASFHDIVG